MPGRPPTEHGSFIDRLGQDVRYALRMLTQRPSFTATIAIILGLGIGANSAMFAVINAMLLTPVPIEEPERVLYVQQMNPARGFDSSNVSYPNMLDLAEQSGLFESWGMSTPINRNIVAGELPERVPAAMVTAGLLEALRTKVHLGRASDASAESVDAPPEMLLTAGFWRQRFAADANIVGREIRVNGREHTVVGVVDSLPTELEADILLPLPIDAEYIVRSNMFLGSVARLRAGATLELARVEAAGIAARLEAEYPETNRGWGFHVEPLRAWLIGEARVPLMILMSIVGLVLLVACANVMSLLLARAAYRAREIALRFALGADSRRIVRQLLTESFLLAGAGAAVSLVVAYLGIGLLRAIVPAAVVNVDDIALNADVLLFTIGISAVTGVVFGLAPALQASRARPHEALKDGGSGATGAGRRQRLRRALVVAQMAAATVLLVVAGVLLSLALRAFTTDQGFNPDHLLAMQIDLAGERYPAEQRVRFVDELLATIQALPGVESAAIGTTLPGAGARLQRGLVRDGEPDPAIEDARWVEYVSVSTGFFETLGTPISSGRDFPVAANGEPVAIVDEALARSFFGDARPTNELVRVWSDEDNARRVIGVVASLGVSPLDPDAPPRIYVPYRDTPFSGVSVVVRSAIDPGELAPAIRGEIMRLDPDQPAYNVRTMTDALGQSTRGIRLVVLVVGGLASLTLLLAAFGLYGVVSYAVSQRTREIGIRVALGAHRREVYGLVLRYGLTHGVLGAAFGLLAATGITRIIASQLRGIDVFQPLAYVAVTVLLLGVTAMASYVPGRRATRVDPLVALRSE